MVWLWAAITAALFALGLATLVALEAAWIPIERISLLPWALAFISLGVTLYALRRRYRLAYGLAEVLVAGIGVVWAFYNLLDKAENRSIAYVLFSSGSLAYYLQLAGSLYVIVRGLDNVGEGLKPYPRLARKWNIRFPTPDM